MRILLVNPRGYCAGVEMAVKSLELALQHFGAPLYVYHQIVHNTYLVEYFSTRGVVFVDYLQDVPVGATLMYSAHGVSPSIRQEARARELNIIDTTCPLVTKVHGEAVRYARKGYTLILVGHRGHDEVVGIMGEAPGAIHLVQSVDEVAALDIGKPKRIAYLTQTTLSVADKQDIETALLRRFPHIEQPRTDDICYATHNRQQAVRKLAAKAQLAIIIGSQNSSNSRRLADIAQSLGTPARMIDSPDELQWHWFTTVGTVLLTSGASVPESLVDETLGWLRQHFDATVEEQSAKQETQHFHMPPQLRRLREKTSMPSAVNVQDPEKAALP
ncbi:MAG TPA: 4-hydroxy-3-methylbut-2-enyl diphosphate reductase [Gammaproteobacteria bacterium]|nr:4-hydroxy-3-methylbut-2-enyl diphosphate reductase [Gammaproteobacteria bacterium]